MTKNKDEFFKKEYESSFQKYFNSLEDFTQAMTEFVISCTECGALYWSGAEKPCACDWLAALRERKQVDQT